jgi:hypothetical protein
VKTCLLWSEVLLKGSHHSCQDNLAECLSGEGKKSYALPKFAISKIFLLRQFNDETSFPGFRDLTFYPTFFEDLSQNGSCYIYICLQHLCCYPHRTLVLCLFSVFNALIAVVTSSRLGGSVQMSRYISAGWICLLTEGGLVFSELT